MIITATELLERYAAGERDFSRINLSDAHLEGVQIYDGIFIECNLSGVGFFESNLRGSIFYGANLSNTIMIDSTFHGANFTQAILNQAKIRNVYFTNAIFSHTNLTGAEWVDLDTEHAIFCQTIMPDGSIRNLNCGW